MVELPMVALPLVGLPTCSSGGSAAGSGRHTGLPTAADCGPMRANDCASAVQKLEGSFSLGSYHLTVPGTGASNVPWMTRM